MTIYPPWISKDSIRKYVANKWIINADGNFPDAYYENYAERDLDALLIKPFNDNYWNNAVLNNLLINQIKCANQSASMRALLSNKAIFDFIREFIDKFKILEKHDLFLSYSTAPTFLFFENDASDEIISTPSIVQNGKFYLNANISVADNIINSINFNTDSIPKVMSIYAPVIDLRSDAVIMKYSLNYLKYYRNTTKICTCDIEILVTKGCCCKT